MMAIKLIFLCTDICWPHQEVFKPSSFRPEFSTPQTLMHRKAGLIPTIQNNFGLFLAVYGKTYESARDTNLVFSLMYDPLNTIQTLKYLYI